jgi:uncharacterized paraquat-inducible protein A
LFVGWLVGWSECVLLFVGLVVGWLLANKQTNKHNDHTIKRAITESDKQHKQTNNTHIHTQTNTHTHTNKQNNKQTNTTCPYRPKTGRDFCHLLGASACVLNASKVVVFPAGALPLMRTHASSAQY